MAERVGQKIKMLSIDELLGVPEEKGVTEIEVAKITGFKNHIVVFTDNRIEVHNRCKEIRTCFISQLAYFIDDYRETSIFTDGIMEQLETVILVLLERVI